MNGLERVAVKMDGMAARVEVVDDNLDDFALLQDKGAGELSVDGGVVCEIARGEGRVEGGHLGLSVGDVVEEGIVLSVAEIVHDDVELHDLVWLRQQLHLVVWYKVHVIKGVEFIDDGSCGEVGLGVVCQPSSDVVVEILGQRIKQGLYEGSVSFVTSVVSLQWMGFASNFLTVSMLEMMGKLAEVSFLVVRRKLTR